MYLYMYIATALRLEQREKRKSEIAKKKKKYGGESRERQPYSLARFDPACSSIPLKRRSRLANGDWLEVRQNSSAVPDGVVSHEGGTGRWGCPHPPTDCKACTRTTVDVRLSDRDRAEQTSWDWPA